MPEGTPGASVIALKRVDELGFYNLGHKELSESVGLTTNKTTAAISLLGLKSDSECYKEIVIGRSRYQRYSQNAIAKIEGLVNDIGPEEIWKRYRDLQTS